MNKSKTISKIWTGLWIILTSTFLCNSSFAMNRLQKIRHVQIKQGSEVGVSFTSKIERNQIEVIYQNDFVQLNIKDVFVYPAKTIPISKGEITKIFAYQFSPNQVRCRFFLKSGKAIDYRNRISLGFSGNLFKIQFDKSDLPVAAEKVETSQEVVQNQMDEKVLLDKIMHSTPCHPVAANHAVSSKAQESAPIRQSVEKSERNTSSEKVKLGGAKPLPSFGPVFLKLLGVTCLFLIIAFLLKKFKLSSISKDSALLKAVSKFAGTPKEPPCIQVISTHRLDQKKSISVVKVLDQVLVLGVTPDSINLISQLKKTDADSDLLQIEFNQSNKPTDQFASILESEKLKSQAPVSEISSLDFKYRSRIRSRLESLKPL